MEQLTSEQKDIMERERIIDEEMTKEQEDFVLEQARENDFERRSMENEN